MLYSCYQIVFILKLFLLFLGAWEACFNSVQNKCFNDEIVDKAI